MRTTPPAWRTPDPPDADEQMRAVDAHVGALVHAWDAGGLRPTVQPALDAVRRRAVLTLYVRWIVAALRLPCDRCGEPAVQEEVT